MDIAPAEPLTTVCPRPVERAVMLQGWHDLASVHWPYEPAVVQRLLPPDLAVDTWEGRAWVGVIPFLMHRVRLPGVPALGPLSTFPETNVRTYVVAPDGRRAVWFASLDVTRLVPALIARVSYGLPYCWARMSIEHRSGAVVECSVRRRWPSRGPANRLAVEVGPSIGSGTAGGIEPFVTARWALASTFLGRTLWADVEHEPWPLHRAELLDWDDSLLPAAGLPDATGDPVVLWSPGVEVRIGRPRRLG